MILWEREREYPCQKTDLSHLRRVYVDLDLDASLCLSFLKLFSWIGMWMDCLPRYTARRRWDLRTQESSMVRGHQSLASSIAKYRVRRDSTLHGWHLKPFAYLRVIQRKWNMWGVSSCWCLCDQRNHWERYVEWVARFSHVWVRIDVISMLVDRTWWTHWLPYILTAYGQILHHLIL